MTITQEAIISLVSWVANVPTSRISPSTHIKEDLNLDSIDFMLLIVKMESFFGVDLSADQLERLETVKDASDFVMRNRLVCN